MSAAANTFEDTEESGPGREVERYRAALVVIAGIDTSHPNIALARCIGVASMALAGVGNKPTQQEQLRAAVEGTRALSLRAAAAAGD